MYLEGSKTTASAAVIPMTQFTKSIWVALALMNSYEL